MGEASLETVVPEAPLEQTEHGLVPAGEGWFVVNVRNARWFESDGLGRYTQFQGDERFPEFGFNLAILQPGEPSSLYHGEDAQEDFLVLAGECLLLVEGEERPLRAWDFVHCPNWTEHIFVGAGERPCLLLGVGSRTPGRGVRYTVHEVALKHRAGVETETSDSREAYAAFADDRPVPCPPEFDALTRRG
jgi:uncharacterized cupin superfamily protein